MTTQLNLKEKMELVRKTALDSGSAIVNAVVIVSEDSSGYAVNLGFDQCLSLLSQCRPRIVYCHDESFDAEKALRVLLDMEDDDEDEIEILSKNSGFKALTKKWAKKNGVTSLLVVNFVVDGVLHMVLEQPEWVDEFESEGEEIESSIAEAIRLESVKSLSAERKQFRDAAKALCDHPRFREGKWSREKREYLAKGLFPDFDDRAIRSIVEEATNMDWVKG